ncbi:Formate dehydrogenase accessory protein FdhD [Granulibacter bethesdensis]|uniref:formate dehydrogenase accessory sulfurtransferase FdhD n=1 Tax=Granulibacter bethesdensis TaxID=364410 RepID=UPI00090C34FC|nr:formate dehydrogenase accessory sulfurtransferase FdhD [Granulibacter bethesdensis]APH57760.1 Formate dehydrogenase accessory protein FdhD [Granulibacter bethesdensis]
MRTSHKVRPDRYTTGASAYQPHERFIPEETPVALTYGRATHAVMMATPADLEDFAVGFSLAEGLIDSVHDIESLEIVEVTHGVELRMDLTQTRDAAFIARRRHVTGATGCGLCGMESLDEAAKSPPRVSANLVIDAETIGTAMEALSPVQTLNLRTHAVHAAAFWQPGQGLLAIREDVGRHNALDKLAGFLARSGIPASSGLVLLTSRVSVEMVQKAAHMGAGIIVAVSAPTTLAIRTAEAANITLAAVARRDGFELFTHPWRIPCHDADTNSDVASNVTWLHPGSTPP